MEVTVTQAQTIPGVATITARSPFGVEKTYTVNLEMTDQIYVSDMDWETDKGGYFENTRDRCGCGAAMKVYEGGNEKEYEKGIGTHRKSAFVLMGWERPDSWRRQEFRHVRKVETGQMSIMW